MKRNHQRRRYRKTLSMVKSQLNMSPKERNQALIEECKEKFFKNGGRAKQIRANSENFSHFVSMNSQDTEAIDFLNA